MNDSRVIVALDYSDADAARAFVNRVHPELCRLKVGKELFVAAGPDFVRWLVACGFEVFLDLKFHDIPNTVAQACKAAAQLGVWMVNLHASGGPTMMRAAREALDELPNPPKLIAVTTLTSMSPADLEAVGLPDAGLWTFRLAGLARNCGMDGVVCSARDVVILRQEYGSDFLLVTPGIRPAGADAGDQVRVGTPGQAVADGSDYLVIGRPITQAPDPVTALVAINREITLVSRDI